MSQPLMRAPHLVPPRWRGRFASTFEGPGRDLSPYFHPYNPGYLNEISGALDAESSSAPCMDSMDKRYRSPASMRMTDPIWSRAGVSPMSSYIHTSSRIYSEYDEAVG
jgi:hypothetical protein